MSTEDPRVIQLQERLALLKKLPEDFRDLEPGSYLWQVFWKEYPDQQEAMAKWSYGPVTCLEGYTALTDIVEQIGHFDEAGYSFIEVDEPKLLGFNSILSHLGYNCRLRLRKENEH